MVTLSNGSFPPGTGQGIPIAHRAVGRETSSYRQSWLVLPAEVCFRFLRLLAGPVFGLPTKRSRERGGSRPESTDGLQRVRTRLAAFSPSRRGARGRLLPGTKAMHRRAKSFFHCAKPGILLAADYNFSGWRNLRIVCLPVASIHPATGHSFGSGRGRPFTAIRMAMPIWDGTAAPAVPFFQPHASSP